MRKPSYFWSALLALAVALFLTTKAFGQTPTPTTTFTPTPTPNQVDEYRGKKIRLTVKEPIGALTAKFWRLDATLETNVEAPRAFPFIRMICSPPEPLHLYSRWYSLRRFPENPAVTSATFSFAAVADITDNTRIFIFSFEDRGVAGATLRPME